MQPVFRFAPSPNGPLHLGHALSALLNAHAAERMKGRLLVRMEDIDLLRCTPQKQLAVLDDLRWIGLQWEEPILYQSNRFDAYQDALNVLKSKGLLYPSTASRKHIQQAIITWQQHTGKTWPTDPDGAPHYPRSLLSIHEQDTPEAAWRLNMKAALAQFKTPLSWQETGSATSDGNAIIDAKPESWGDVVLARKDYPTSYHLAVTVDDAYQDITHVIRGLDLFHATSVHRLLQALLGLPAPIYHHHRLLTGKNGQKLAKSCQDIGLATLRSEGWSPASILKAIKLTKEDLAAFPHP